MIRAPRLLLLDHEDSFSANLGAALGALGSRVDVVRLTRGQRKLGEAFTPEALEHKYEGLVLSPGPGHPREHPATLALCSSLLEADCALPLLGVCLGLQLAAHTVGASVRSVCPLPVHGRRVPLVGRYALGHAFAQTVECEGHVTLHNSLGVGALDLAFSRHFRVLAQAEGAVALAVRETAPWLLCQFHPESFGSTAGLPFLKAFVERCRSPNAARL